MGVDTLVLISAAALSAPAEADCAPFVWNERAVFFQMPLTPVFPAEAAQYETANGQIVGIVPEKLLYKTINTTEMVPSCGMAWCGSHAKVPMVTGTKRVCENYPTPLPDIESALVAAGITRDDQLWDLGSGDGRVCIMASKMFNCFTVGLDKRPEAVALAESNAELNGVDNLCAFFAFTIRGQRLRHATVVYCYLKPSTLAEVAKQLPSNVRVAISYKHPWPGNRGEKIGEFYVWRREAQPTAKTMVARRSIRLCSS